MLLASGDLGYNVVMIEQTDKSGQAEPKPMPMPMQKRPLYKRWWLWAIVGLVAAFLVCIGPWPAYYESYEGTDYAEATFARLGELDLTPTDGPFHAGAAKVEITPKVGEPLAGFSARDPKACEGVIDKLYARAITLSNGRKTVTIVGGDILLIMPKLRDTILSRTGLPREDVYFTASHTHCGPGGYSSRWIDEISLGEYDEAVFNRLANAFARAITLSRHNLSPAILATTSDQAPGDPDSFVRNRIDKQAPAHTTISSIMILPHEVDTDNFCIGSLVVASPHPTCYGKSTRKAAGDYPGVLQNKIESSSLTSTCMFAIGSPGSMSPAKNAPKGAKRAKQVASAIVPQLADLTTSSKTCQLASAVLEVDLPPIQVRIGNYFRLSPVAGRYLHSRRSYIHILRINDLVLLGMPADYSGELTMELEKYAAEQTSTLIPVVTSFNGDYIGYLIHESRYHLDHYESREMNFFGPYCGDYFNALARKTLEYIYRADQVAESKK